MRWRWARGRGARMGRRTSGGRERFASHHGTPPFANGRRRGARAPQRRRGARRTRTGPGRRARLVKGPVAGYRTGHHEGAHDGGAQGEDAQRHAGPSRHVAPDARNLEPRPRRAEGAGAAALLRPGMAVHVCGTCAASRRRSYPLRNTVCVQTSHVNRRIKSSWTAKIPGDAMHAGSAPRMFRISRIHVRV